MEKFKANDNKNEEHLRLATDNLTEKAGTSESDSVL